MTDCPETSGNLPETYRKPAANIRGRLILLKTCRKPTGGGFRRFSDNPSSTDHTVHTILPLIPGPNSPFVVTSATVSKNPSSRWAFLKFRGFFSRNWIDKKPSRSKYFYFCQNFAVIIKLVIMISTVVFWTFQIFSESAINASPKFICVHCAEVFAYYAVRIFKLGSRTHFQTSSRYN